MAPGSRSELGGLPVRQQELAAFNKGRLPYEGTLTPVFTGAVEEVIPLVRAPHAAHPARPMPNADNTHNAFDARVDCPDPDHCRSSITGAINPQAISIYFRQRAEKCHGGLYICYTTVGSEATPCAGAFSPAFIIKRHHHIARFV